MVRNIVVGVALTLSLALVISPAEASQSECPVGPTGVLTNPKLNSVEQWRTFLADERVAALQGDSVNHERLAKALQRLLPQCNERWGSEQRLFTQLQNHHGQNGQPPVSKFIESVRQIGGLKVAASVQQEEEAVGSAPTPRPANEVSRRAFAQYRSDQGWQQFIETATAFEMIGEPAGCPDGYLHLDLVAYSVEQHAHTHELADLAPAGMQKNYQAGVLAWNDLRDDYPCMELSAIERKIRARSKGIYIPIQQERAHAAGLSGELDVPALQLAVAELGEAVAAADPDDAHSLEELAAQLDEVQRLVVGYQPEDGEDADAVTGLLGRVEHLEITIEALQDEDLVGREEFAAELKELRGNITERLDDFGDRLVKIEGRVAKNENDVAELRTEDAAINVRVDELKDAVPDLVAAEVARQVAVVKERLRDELGGQQDVSETVDGLRGDIQALPGELAAVLADALQAETPPATDGAD